MTDYNNVVFVHNNRLHKPILLDAFGNIFDLPCIVLFCVVFVWVNFSQRFHYNLHNILLYAKQKAHTICVGLYPPKPLCAGGKARSRPVGVCCADLTRCG